MTATTSSIHRAKQHLLRRKKTLLKLLGDARSEKPALAAGAEMQAALATSGEHERNELVEVEAALVRIENGTWGACETCGGPIGKQRLLALPEARLCLACREGSEQNAQ